MLDLVKELVTKTPSYGYDKGFYAHFKRIDTKWGLKFYHSKNMRDKTFSLQQRAFEIDCAPRLGDKFDLKTPEGRTVYGYITECIVKTANEMYEEKTGYCDCEDVDLEETFPEYVELIDRLKEVMEDVYDMHGANVGIMPNGRWVAIDFSGCD